MLRACRSIDISGTSPEPPPTSSAGCVALPHEPAADRPAYLDLVADDQLVVQERRDLAVVEPLDGEVDLVAVSGWRRDRVRARRGVPVFGGESHDVVLAREMRRRPFEPEPERLGARGLGPDAR